MWIRIAVFTAFMIIAAFISGFSGYAFAQVTGNVTVDVSIASVAEITVSPTSIAWLEVAPGSVGGYRYLTVTNTGSTNVTNMYAYMDNLVVESSRPYDAPDPGGYAAGNIVTITNQSNFTVNQSFVGRIEWNHTTEIPNIDKSNVNWPAGWGWYRNQSNEYVWIVGNGSSETIGGNGTCNTTDAQFAIENDIDTGIAATRTPITTGIAIETVQGAWGIFTVNNSASPLYDMCVAVNYTCDRIFIYKYDKRSEFGQCSSSRFLKDAILPPADTETLRLDAYVPRGLPVGNLSQSQLTIAATG